jgi:hypothetical protein
MNGLLVIVVDASVLASAVGDDGIDGRMAPDELRAAIRVLI